MLWQLRTACGLREIGKRGAWRKQSSGRAVPLSRIQKDILRLLAAHRNPESYVAGSTPLNRDAPRYSGDIVFHDREERVAQAAVQDGALLQENGYALQWLRREPAIYSVLAARQEETTRLEWVADTDFRFFPTMPDETFGYILHPIDLATNKVSAAYGRREPRDVVDLLTIHERILPLGAVVWAGLDGIRRNLTLGPPPARDFWEMSDDERAAAGVRALPRSLGEALANLAASPAARQWFGDLFFDVYLRFKQAEERVVAGLNPQELCARYAEVY